MGTNICKLKGLCDRVDMTAKCTLWWYDMHQHKERSIYMKARSNSMKP